jgi:AcrR family transcriptional regulator
MIVVGAEDTFSRLGYKGATMAGIAERAGVTRSVLTRHYATKAELFAEVTTKPLLQFVDEWTRRWTSRLDGQPTEPELVYEFISDLYRNSRAHVGALRLLMFSDEHLDPAAREQVWGTLNKGLGAVLDIANREIGSHGYPTRHVDVTVRALITYGDGIPHAGPGVVEDRHHRRGGSDAASGFADSLRPGAAAPRGD